MALKAGDLRALGDTAVAFKSVAFANVHMRMDGSTLTGPNDQGGGTINCRYGPPSLTEGFLVRPQADGSIALESLAAPNRFLRMDGSTMTAGADNGGGVVNCAYGGAGLYEKFNARDQADGSVALESVHFPNRFLRMDGRNVTAAASPGGTVNCAFGGAGPYEKFLPIADDLRLVFTMEHQVQTNWCAFASTVSVAKYYNAGSAWTQCSLVNDQKALATCCGAAGSDTATCNQGAWPDQTLTRVGHFRDLVNAALTVDQVRLALQAGNPIVLDTRWADNSGHALAVSGRFRNAAGVDYVCVADPWYGYSDVPYTTFRDAYQGQGRWTRSYRTKKV